MKSILKNLLFLLALLPVYLSADTLIDNYLSAEESDVTAQSKEVASLYQKYQPDNSYIEKARLSVRHSHFSDVERDYALRLYAKDPAEMRHKREIHALEERLALTDGAVRLLNIRRDRYETLLDLLYTYSRIRLLDDEIAFGKEALRKAKYLVQNASDITAVYKKKEALSDARLRRESLQMQFDALLGDIVEVTGVKKTSEIEKSINLLLFVSPYSVVDFISSDIENNNSLLAEEHPVVVKDVEATKLVEQKVKSAEDENGIRLDYVGLKYNDSKKSKNAFAVDVAVEIPFAKDTEKILSQKVKLLKKRQKALQNRKKIARKREGLKHEIRNLIHYFHALDAQISETVPRKKNYYAYKLYESMQKRNLRLQKDRLKVSYRIAQKYIELLYWSNRLHSNKFAKLLQRESQR